MAFEQLGLNYAVEYSAALANAYPYLSYFSQIWNGPNSNTYKPVRAKTVMIPSLDVSGARMANRDRITGQFNRNFNDAMQACEMSMDREWDTLIDPMDMEQDRAVTVANITKTFTEFQKVPEMDAYAASKLAGYAQGFGTVDSTVLSADNILATWDGYLAYMTDQRINRDRLICKMTPAAYKLLKEAAGITRFVQADTGIRNVDRNVGKLDGVLIEEVPSDIMQTSFDFADGWVVQPGSQTINMLLIDPLATVAPIVYDTSMMSAPTAATRGKYIYYERYYYDVFALNRRLPGIFANIGNPTIGTLTVTSVAGTSSGNTQISVAEPAPFGCVYMYQLNSADPSLEYGDAVSGYTPLVQGADIAASSNTNVTVALVNVARGNIAVAAGNATIVKNGG